MNNRIAIVGGGGLGRETLALIRQINAVNPVWDPVGFFDDAIPKGQRVGGIPILGSIKEIIKSDDITLVLAIGSPTVKKAIVSFPGIADRLFATLIHPSVVLANESGIRIGKGCVIAAGAKITTEVLIGNHVLINLNATIGHDTIIGDCSSIMPGVNLAGFVRLGKAVLVGSGASIINNSSIGDFAIVGAGAVVIEDVPGGATVVGVPARILKK